MGVTVGTTALVARFTGADKPEEVEQATGQSLTLGFLLGILGFAATYALRGRLAGVMLNAGANPQAAALCVRFLSMALLGVVPAFIWMVFLAAFRGVGDTRIPLVITCFAIATHICLDVTLIYGRFGIPKMGVGGAGIAYSMSNVVGMGMSFALLRFRPSLRGALRLRHLALSREWAARILRIGLPAAAQAMLRTVSMMSFTGMLAHTVEKDAAVAALQIGLRCESIAFMPGSATAWRRRRSWGRVWGRGTRSGRSGAVGRRRGRRSR